MPRSTHQAAAAAPRSPGTAPLSGRLLGSAALLLAAGFVGNLPLPKSVDSAAWISLADPLAVDLGLLGAWIVLRVLPVDVLPSRRLLAWRSRLASRVAPVRLFDLAALIVVAWLWQPLGGVVWQLDGAVACALLHGLFAVGWSLLLLALWWPAGVGPRRRIVAAGCALWATPGMSSGHLLLAAAGSSWLLFGGPRQRPATPGRNRPPPRPPPAPLHPTRHKAYAGLP